KAFTRLPVRIAKPSRKCVARTITSSLRSRNGGIDRDYAQPIVEVFPESSGLHFLLEVPLGGADEAHIHLDRLVAADPLELPLLQYTQELDLHHRRDLPDLVQEDGALVRQLEPPLALPQRARKGPTLMPEEFGLKQRLRKGGAAD